MKKFIRDTFSASTILVISSILCFKSFAYNTSYVPSGSMSPTISDRALILVDTHSYGLRIPFTKISFLETGVPVRGDIAVFRMPLKEDTNYIKRIVAVPGDTLYYNEDGYVVNKKPEHPERYKMVIIPADKYFAMGDNVHHSYDSRFWGFVPKENLVGRYVTTVLDIRKLPFMGDKQG